jgi:hypothetical protein
MCPECFATVALVLTGIISSGGLTAVTAKLLRNNKKAVERISAVPKPNEKENLK